MYWYCYNDPPFDIYNEYVLREEILFFYILSYDKIKKKVES